jgi:hypothetical protein
MVLYLDCPEAALVDRFVRSSAPTTLFADSPARVAAYLAISRKNPPIEAIRGASKAFATINGMFVRQNVYDLRMPAKSTSLRSCIQSVAEFYNVPFDEQMLDRAVSALMPGQSLGRGADADSRTSIHKFEPTSPSISGWLQNLTEYEQAMVKAVGDDLSPSLDGRPSSSFLWPPQMFVDADALDQNMPHSIELTGRARLLVYGPYLYLPRGEWIASFFVEVAGCFSPNTFRIDVCQNFGEEIAVGRIDFAKDGIFRVDLLFEVTEAVHPLESRISLDRGSIDGVMKLLKVEVMRNDVAYK